MRSLDEKLSSAIHRLQLGAFDYVLLVPGLMFGSFGVPVLIVVMGVWLGWQFGLVAFMASVTTVALTGPLKHLIGRPRPATPPGHRAVSLRSLVDNPALPSGDSAQAASMVALLVMAGPADDWRRWLFVPLAPLCMFARVYYGAHWLSDTLAGALIGAVVGAMYAHWFGAFMAG